MSRGDVFVLLVVVVQLLAAGSFAWERKWVVAGFWFCIACANAFSFLLGRASRG